MYKIESHLKESVSSFRVFDDVDSTTSYCTVEGPFPSRFDNYASLLVEVKWRGQDPKMGKYYSHLLKSILEKFILLELDSSKSISISLYLTGSSKYSLLCGINASLLGLISLGIPLRGMFYGIQTNDKLLVYDEEKEIFHHSVDSSGEYTKEDILEYTKEVIRFTIRDQHTVKI